MNPGLKQPNCFRSGDNQIFSVSLEALDDLIVVGSIGVGSEGMAYVYKMHEEMRVTGVEFRLSITTDLLLPIEIIYL